MVSTSANASKPSSTNRIFASFSLTAPLGSGRPAVRFTKPSTLRSAKSLITQPAARITNTPSTNTTSTGSGGTPISDSQSAHSVGHSSSSVPIGLSIRIRRL